jgi:hypothetical protein
VVTDRWTRLVQEVVAHGGPGKERASQRDGGKTGLVRVWTPGAEMVGPRARNSMTTHLVCVDCLTRPLARLTRGGAMHGTRSQGTPGREFSAHKGLARIPLDHKDLSERSANKHATRST